MSQGDHFSDRAYPVSQGTTVDGEDTKKGESIKRSGNNTTNYICACTQHIIYSIQSRRAKERTGVISQGSRGPIQHKKGGGGGGGVVSPIYPVYLEYR